MMRSGIRPGASPVLHLLGEYDFQELCRDLLDEEPDTASCDVYGVRGQRQHGIDLLAFRANSDGIEVGQCRCYREFPPADIRKASHDFFRHWGHWSDKDVRRFHLFVACDLSRRERQDELLEQRRCFASRGIDYVPWSGTRIISKLGPYAHLVRRYLVYDHWVQAICGMLLPTLTAVGKEGTPSSVFVQARPPGQVKVIATRLAGVVERDLERMRDASRRGRRAEPIGWVRKLKRDDAIWQSLSTKLKARVLRFEATMELQVTNNVDRAKQLAEKAQALAPWENQDTLRAMIAFREIGPEAALELLRDQRDIDSLNLRAILLLQIGRIAECQAILDSIESGLENNEG